MAWATQHSCQSKSTSSCFVHFWPLPSTFCFFTLLIWWCTSNQSKPTKGILKPQSKSSRHLRTKNIKSTSSCSVHFFPVQFWPFPVGRGVHPWSIPLHWLKSAVLNQNWLTWWMNKQPIELKKGGQSCISKAFHAISVCAIFYVFFKLWNTSFIANPMATNTGDQ